MTAAFGARWAVAYFVPASQVHPGSRGMEGTVHLQVAEGFYVGERITRSVGQTLCGRRGRYVRPAEPGENKRCSVCDERASRYQITWPEVTE